MMPMGVELLSQWLACGPLPKPVLLGPASSTAERREEQCLRASDSADLWVTYLQFANAAIVGNEGRAPIGSHRLCRREGSLLAFPKLLRNLGVDL